MIQSFGPKPGQTHTRTLPRHRTSCRFSDHALHLPSREVGRSPKPTPIRHVRTHHSRSVPTGPGPAPQRVCFRQNSRHIKPTPARCCSRGHAQRAQSSWWPPQSGDPALCHTGAVRDRGGVCRTTSLTHGVREGGPDTSGRKTARGNTDRRMQSDGDWATRMSVRLTPCPGVTRETPLTPLGVTRERLDPPDVFAPEGAPGG